MIAVVRCFLSEAAARRYLDSYVRSYPPAGYGTTLRLNFSYRDMHWWVRGYRAKSAD